MFVETNEIESVIVNIDGLIRIEGERLIYPQSLIRNSRVEISLVQVDSKIAEALAYIAEGYELRIVSSLPESQLEDVLTQCFNPPLEAEGFSALNSIEQLVLTWPISRALVSCGSKPCKCVFLCGDIRTIKQAQSLRLGTIFWDHEVMEVSDKVELFRKGPDFIVHDSKEVIDIFEKRYIGYLGEVLSVPPGFFGKHDNGQYVNTISFPNLEFPDSPIHLSGRYFKKDDPRNRKHALSLRILDSKNRMYRHKWLFARIIGEMILYLVGDEFDCVTRVPPKPSETEDRIREQIEYIPELELRGKKDR